METRIRAELAATFAAERQALDVERAQRLAEAPYLPATVGPRASRPRRGKAAAAALAARIEADYAARVAALEADQERRVQEHVAHAEARRRAV